MITPWNWIYQSVTNQSTLKYQKETSLKQTKIQEYKLMESADMFRGVAHGPGWWSAVLALNSQGTPQKS